VQFTAAQKEQIQAFVDSGNAMGAQKVILGELTSEVGGSAAAYGDTFAGQISKAKEQLKNTRAASRTTALPVMKQLADWGPAAAEGFEKRPAPVKEGAVVVAALVAAVGPLSYVFGAAAKAVSGLISVIGFLSNNLETIALKALYAKDALASAFEAGTIT